MTTVDTLRTAIASAVDGIDGLRCTPYWTDTVAPPQAMLLMGDIDYDTVFGRRGDTYPLELVVFAGRIAERSAEKFLDTLREPSGVTSIKTVIEADAGIDAVCDYVVVRRVRGTESTTVAETVYLTCTFEIEVGV